jgi:hypothetical protein
VEQVRHSYLKLKPLIRRILQLDDHDTLELLLKPDEATRGGRVDSVDELISDLARLSLQQRLQQHEDRADYDELVSGGGKHSELGSDDRRDFFSKRAYMSGSSERFDRLGKGKRVKNMFSSGLQGVWGVPGRR